MRHSKSLDLVAYEDFLKAFEEDYNFLEDKQSIWKMDTDENYEPSSEEDEMESEASP